MGKRSLAVVLLGAALAWGCGKSQAADSGAGNQGAASSGGETSLPAGPIPSARPLHKLDLLLMVDNSFDMGEKQRLLKDAVSWMLGPGGPPLSADDVHVGVVTSSLGEFGGRNTTSLCNQPKHDDHARLLGSLRPGLETYQNSGFLAWGPDVEHRDRALALLEPMLDAVGEDGCTYEASLEAWYRFLVDPEPPGAVELVVGETIVRDIDATVLAQRAAFLRPDSVLAIVVLSDENDCSVVSEGLGWTVAYPSRMLSGTSACEANPNDPCCQPCSEDGANPSCPAIADDPACSPLPWVSSDELVMRCWDQKRRFGVDLLYPIERYQDGLTQETVPRRSTGQVVVNPIFDGRQRHPSQVIYAGIVGVPWQDLADEASLIGEGLTFLRSAQLANEKRWDVMLGDPAASPPVLPTDAFMLDTRFDRSTLSSVHENPLTGDVIVSSSSLDPRGNAINGHETDTYHVNLQAACIFPLATPKVCDDDASAMGTGCRCFVDQLITNNAVCQPPGGGEPTTTQYYEAAYPGIRHLRLLKALGDTAVTASICPKVFEPDHPDFGYRPAMRALAERVEAALSP